MLFSVIGGKLLLWVIFEMMWWINGNVRCGYLIIRYGCICFLVMLVMWKIFVYLSFSRNRGLFDFLVFVVMVSLVMILYCFLVCLCVFRLILICMLGVVLFLMFFCVKIFLNDILWIYWVIMWLFICCCCGCCVVWLLVLVIDYFFKNKGWSLFIRVYFVF